MAHAFYQGTIENPFENKLLVIAENGKELWTNCFKIAKEHALKNQLIAEQLKLL